MRKIIYTLTLSLCLIGASSKNDVVAWVLQSKNINDLYGGNNPTMDDRRYVWSISDKLIEIIIKDVDDNNAWMALHKFRGYTDAGITTMFNQACYKAIKSNPLIFYNRFMKGDEEALKRAKDAVWGATDYSMGVAQESAKLILKINSKNKRHKIFLDELNNEINKVAAEINHITWRSTWGRQTVAAH